MASPRVFISSTFYDLKYVRADLDRFIRELGYEPILHERSAVAYGSGEKLDAYCYREIQQCDILVAIIGGRYGSDSSLDEGSISQVELRTAQRLSKQVYVFVESKVLAEFETYRLNPAAEIHFAHVDNPKIYEFIQHIYGLPNNNAVFPFAMSTDITETLRTQWAGLFQRFLNNAEKIEERRTVESLTAAVETLNSLNKLFLKSEPGKTSAVEEVLLSKHPLAEALRVELDLDFGISFRTIDEMDSLLQQFGFRRHQDTPHTLEWILPATQKTAGRVLTFEKSLFDEAGKLNPIRPMEFNGSQFYSTSKPQLTGYGFASDDDDIPF